MTWDSRNLLAYLHTPLQILIPLNHRNAFKWFPGGPLRNLGGRSRSVFGTDGGECAVKSGDKGLRATCIWSTTNRPLIRRGRRCNQTAIDEEASESDGRTPDRH